MGGLIRTEEEEIRGGKEGKMVKEWRRNKCRTEERRSGCWHLLYSSLNGRREKGRTK